MKIEYPKWLYRDGQEPVIVNNKEEHEAMKGWSESPAQEKEEPKRRGRPRKDD